jgi:hypothetical protein
MHSATPDHTGKHIPSSLSARPGEDVSVRRIVSNRDPLDLIERYFVARPIVELGGWGLSSSGTENQHNPILAKGLVVDRLLDGFM